MVQNIADSRSVSKPEDKEYYQYSIAKVYVKQIKDFQQDRDLRNQFNLRDNYGSFSSSEI
ncbi:hypothetical protein EGI16_00535 [Chryseobacterium sp. G0240]|uniref:hypothetical protein n=1 Tax=Chryseobacterium sp. G0240 TaxID=2487066 RepID=UPI000F45E320|nr:hypothetical protein [Chryseobacterium sp. G0240]ROI06426.1 hypothetical protein EGI16_00535 [Chryseobacterium sp. G0240]